MKKIMFNDKYDLTQAVLDGRKTMTRRRFTMTLYQRDKSSGDFIKVLPDSLLFEANKWMFGYDGNIYPLPKINYPLYKVNEEVAIAQSYDSFYNDSCDPRIFPSGAGWTNKMFVKPELMPHRIKITEIKVERLQDISDEDCLKEGVFYFGDKYVYDYPNGDSRMIYNTPREAFSALIDKVSGKDTWNLNPYVFAYKFELIK